MSQGWRWLSVALLGVHTACMAGCAGSRTATLPTERESLAADLAREESPRLARLQQAELPTPKLAAPMPPLPPQAPTTDGTILPAPPASGTKQASLSVPSSRKVTVRAWVNGKPIFDDEVMQSLPRSAMRELGKLSESLRTEKLTELFNQALDQIIEQEVVYQEAVRKLEKVNPRTLEKLKTLAEQEFEKGLKPLANTPGVSADEVNEFKRIMRRPTERSFISMEYMRSRIFPLLQQAISYPEIKDYYDTHQNEFQRVETVKWQDVFIAVGPKLPTLADARRFAEDLIAQCRTGADFAKLIQYDDGASKFQDGEGQGSRRGEIHPAEVEAHLFKMRDGEIGPVVELSTGVHIFRLISRDPGGFLPLNEAVQNQIRAKLRNQLADREYKRIARELRSRAVIEVVTSAP
jgi:parvulin-like peptidyl-prolyl isomerase